MEFLGRHNADAAVAARHLMSVDMRRSGSNVHFLPFVGNSLHQVDKLVRIDRTAPHVHLAAPIHGCNEPTEIHRLWFLHVSDKRSVLAVLALRNGQLVCMIADIGSDAFDGCVLVHRNIADNCELVEHAVVVALVLGAVLCIQPPLFRDIAAAAVANELHTSVDPECEEQLLGQFVGPIET